MHEGNFTQKIIDSIMDELKKHPDASPKVITVKVGETYHLEPESVQMHFKSLTQGTNLEQSELILKEIPFTVRCASCRWEGRAEDHHFPFCSSCSSTQVEVLDGNSVIIEEIELVQ